VPEVCPPVTEVIDTPFGPVRVRLVEGLPDDAIFVYSAPPPGTFPGHPDWVPLERRAAKIVL